MPPLSSRQRYPVLYGYSPAVLPKPEDWDDSLHVTGYWFLDSPSDWQPPAALVDFLKAGPPPVYAGFGSMAGSDPDALSAMVVEALARVKQRGILASGWGGLAHANLPDHVIAVESVPHDWLFPQMAAVVHHGGAGTTATGLRVGVPSIVVPFLADQFFWGQRVAQLGVGSNPIPRQQLTVQRLAAAIDGVVNDQIITERHYEQIESCGGTG
jgi:sterol 3beta-glucosyltransferase